MKKFILRIWSFLEGLVVKRPGAVLIAGLAVVVLSFFAAGGIEMKTKIQDMLPADNPQVVSYTEIDDLFNGGSTVLLTISGAGRENILKAAEVLVEEVRSNPSLTALSRSIYYGLNEDFVDKWALVLQDADDLERTAELYEKTDLLHYFSALNRSVEEAWTGDEPDQDLENFRQEAEAVAWLNQLDRGMTLISEALEGPNPSSYGEELAQVMSVGDLNGFNDEGTMLMVTIVPDFNMVDFEKIELMMKEVRVLLDRMRKQFPELSFAYTGDVPIQSDEQAALGFDMLIPTLVAVFLILVLFIASFQRIATIFYLLISLIAGVVVTYGFLGITIREVNMLTSVFGVLLVGLGVDYGIQVASNYRGYRMQGMDIARAMSTTYRRAGTGVVLAALTTSVAFFVLAGTGTMAFRQFGFVLGSGILFCLFVMTSILPAFLVLSDRRRQRRREKKAARQKSGSGTQAAVPKDERRGRRVLEFRFLTSTAEFSRRHRRSVLILTAFLTVALGATAVMMLRMDYDLMSMEPQDMPSIVAYHDVMESYGITPFHSMVVADDLADARALTDALESESQIADLASAADLVPPRDEQLAALEIIRRIRDDGNRYEGVTWSVDDVEALSEQIQRLEWNVIEMADLSVAGLGDGNRIQARRDAMIREILGAETGAPGREVFQVLINTLEANPEQSAAALTALDEAFGPALADRVDVMTQVDRPVTVDDLPDDIRRRFFADGGEKNLLYIYPKDGMMESAESMRRFNDDLAQVDSRITGSAQIAIAWLDEAVKATLLSALYIFLTVAAFLFLMLRNPGEVLRAGAPLVIGMIWMLGLYALAGLKLNFLNLVVIPLVIGMGIDFGIHLTHRYRVEGNIEATYRMTGKAVFLSGSTTLIGFGSLALIGKFPSIASMGAILAFGIATCLATGFIVLPALLEKPVREPLSRGQQEEVIA